MGRIVGATLYWEGPIGDIAQVAGREGIYLVVAGQKGAGGDWDDGKWTLLDVGQLPDTVGKLASPERHESWDRQRPADTNLLFKFAEMPVRKFDATDRLIVESCLRRHHPVLADGTADRYRGDDVVVISNTGRFAPLANWCSCLEPGC